MRQAARASTGGPGGVLGGPPRPAGWRRQRRQEPGQAGRRAASSPTVAGGAAGAVGVDMAPPGWSLGRKLSTSPAVRVVDGSQAGYSGERGGWSWPRNCGNSWHPSAAPDAAGRRALLERERRGRGGAGGGAGRRPAGGHDGLPGRGLWPERLRGNRGAFSTSDQMALLAPGGGAGGRRSGGGVTCSSLAGGGLLVGWTPTASPRAISNRQPLSDLAGLGEAKAASPPGRWPGSIRRWR